MDSLTTMKMRWLYLSLFVLCTSSGVFGQIAFELEKMNVLYMHLPNPMNIVMQGMARKDIRVSCMHHCTVVDADSIYYVSPALIGECYVVLQNKNGDTIAKETFRALPIPPPQTSLGSISSGVHAANSISNQHRINVDFASGFAYEGMSIHPEYISLKMPIQDAPRVQHVNECKILDNVLEDYVLDGKHHKILNRKNKNNPSNDFLHLLDGDTFNKHQ